MITLPSTSHKLQIVLGGAVTDNRLQCTASWDDVTSGPTFTPGVSNVLTNDTTDVDFVAAPSASTQRRIKSLTVYNADTATAAPHLKLDISGTEYTVWKGVLATGELLSYHAGEWTKTNANGDIILVGSTGAAGTNGTDGVDGVDGVDGTDGVDGADYTDAWMYFATTYSVVPAVVGTPTGTTVYSYTLDGTTRYRSVPDTYDPTTDAFYTSWSGSAVSGLIVARG